MLTTDELKELRAWAREVKPQDGPGARAVLALLDHVDAAESALREAQAERDTYRDAALRAHGRANAAAEREARLVAAVRRYAVLPQRDADGGDTPESIASFRAMCALADATPTPTTDAEEADRGPDATPAEETGR